MHKPFKFRVTIRSSAPLSPVSARCDCCNKLKDANDIYPQVGPVDVGEYFICNTCVKDESNKMLAIETNRRLIRISIQLNAVKENTQV